MAKGFLAMRMPSVIRDYIYVNEYPDTELKVITIGNRRSPGTKCRRTHELRPGTCCWTARWDRRCDTLPRRTPRHRRCGTSWKVSRKCWMGLVTQQMISGVSPRCPSSQSMGPSSMNLGECSRDPSASKPHVALCVGHTDPWNKSGGS